MLTTIAIASFAWNSAAVAAPADDIRRAVAVGGLNSTATAPAPQFLRAFRAVVAGVPRAAAPNYVADAILARPELVIPIVRVGASTIVQPGKSVMKPAELALISAIVQSAIRAAPSAAAEITAAVVEIHPAARGAILAAAVHAAPQAKDAIASAASRVAAALAFATMTSDGVAALGASWSDARANPDENVRSPEKKPAPRS